MEKIVIPHDEINGILFASVYANPLKKFLWILENDLGTSAEIAKAHPELNDTFKEIIDLWKSMHPKIRRINTLIKKIVEVSPKQ